MRSFVAIDFETANTYRHSPCAIAMVKVIDGVIVQRIFSLIRPPENEYSEHNIRVHGIKPEHSEYAPDFTDVYPLIKKMVHLHHVVCHNASFDLDVLRQTMNYYSMNFDELDFDYSDTYQLYGKALDVCCNECGIALNHHDCLSDAEACAKLFMHHHNMTQNEYNPKKQTKSYNDIERHEKFQGDILKQELESVLNKTNPFYNKKVVITGTYSNWPDRKELALLIKELGADIDGSVSKSTQILIAGENSGPSKLEKMKINISLDPSRGILNENDIITIFNSLTTCG